MVQLRTKPEDCKYIGTDNSSIKVDDERNN